MSSTIGACLPAGAAHDHGLVPTVFLRPPHGAIAGLALVDEKGDAALARRRQREVHRGAEMVGVAQPDRADAVQLGARGSPRWRRGPRAPGPSRRGRRSTPRHRRRSTNTGFGHRLAHARPQAGGVPGQAHHAVRLMSPQVRLHQRVGGEARVRVRHAAARRKPPSRSRAAGRARHGYCHPSCSSAHASLLPLILHRHTRAMGFNFPRKRGRARTQRMSGFGTHPLRAVIPTHCPMS